ncbi:MAG: hypothetical protein P1U56_24590 [Saprospiraceae bacterium]|nr:hypothetical protein [Saprospiraceae bacterium]
MPVWVAALCISCSWVSFNDVSAPTDEYDGLVGLFQDWRQFENPPLYEGAPDYRRETFLRRQDAFATLQSKFAAIDTTAWTIPQKVDWYILRAEMKGYDFNVRILKPWERDPAFYKCLWTYRSDVPAHEGPTNHGTTEIWMYDFPLSKDAEKNLIKDLQVIPPFYKQAKLNLIGNAKDLWIAGIRDIKRQATGLQDILNKEGVSDSKLLVEAIDNAIAATKDLADWLEKESVHKTGPSGIGKDNYTYYLQQVHLVPLTWEDEVMILKRELARAWASLKLEEHRNRHLPPLVDADSPEKYDAMAKASAESLLTFLEEQDIVTVADYFKPALDAHLGEYIPKETRNFFWITAHYDPRPLYSHFYHWFELAQMDTHPHESAIRRDPLLYNIFDSRNEGIATAVEEMFMQAGLYDDNPRVKEIVYIMIAQRAARGLGSLYAHANEMTMEEAGGIHSEYTPRGWMKTEKELLLFEQHLYLRQPGYGTSYITGKYMVEDALADFARIKESNGDEFQLKDFFDQINAIGNIPISLSHWEMTGVDTGLKIIDRND